MPIDPNIALQVQPAHFDSPLQTIGALMQFRNQSAELVLRQAQAEQERQKATELQAQTEQRNRDLRDSNTIQEALGDPTFASAFGKGDFTAIQPKVQPKTLEALQKWHDTHQQALLANTEQKNKIDQVNYGKIEDTVNGLLKADPADLPELSSGAIQNLKAQGAFDSFPGAQIPDVVTDPRQLTQFMARLGLLQSATNKALAQQKAQGEIAHTTAQTSNQLAEAGLKTAQTPGAEAESAIKGIELSFMKGATPQNADSLIDARIPPKEFPEQNAGAKSAYRLALAGGATPKEAAVAAEKVAATVDEIRKQKAEIPGEISRAVAVAKATAPIEEGRALRVASANRAESGAEKLDTEYNNAKATTDSIGRVLDLAEAGNKAAGANVPLMGVGAVNAVNGIKRINSAEIHQYGTAGSLLDKIQGKLQGWTEGQPIPKDVLDDMRTLHNELGQQAYEKYTTGLKSLEQRSGAKLSPTIPAPAARSAIAGVKIATPTSKAEYDALPKGAHYLKNGQEFVKQ